MPHRPGTVAAQLVRAVAALFTLVLFVVAIPYALLTLGRLPTSVPSAGDVSDALLSPDDGSLLRLVLTLTGWGFWAALLIALSLEIAAVLRRRTARRRTGLAPLQGLVAWLLGGIVLLAAPAASAATAVPSTAVSAPQLPRQDSTPAPTAGSTAQAAGPTHRVEESNVTLWGIAEERLGDGTRWQEIANLNPDLPLQGGTLPPGTVIHLPADAEPEQPADHALVDAGGSTSAEPDHEDPASPESAPADGSSAAAGERPVHERGGSGQPDPAGTEAAPGAAAGAVTSYEVRSGDSLWSIAEATYGDGAQYPKIFEVNRGEPQPYGHTFTDADLIFPGQKLDLPGASSRAPDRQPGEQQDQRPRAPGGDDAPADGQAPSDDRDESRGKGHGEKSEQHRSDGIAPPTETSGPAEDGGGHRERGQEDMQQGEVIPPSAPGGGNPPPAPSSPRPAPAPDGESPAPEERPARIGVSEPADSSSSEIALVSAIGAGVLATGMISLLARRRIRQQRRRRHGRRIAMPTGRAAATEQQLRATAAPHGVEFLDAALRTAAWHLAEDGGQLPELIAAVLGTDGVTLHLAEDAAPVPPFRAASEEDMRRWWCPAATRELLAGYVREQVEAPYPSLVSLGRDAAEALVLIDLEHFGVLYLTGARHKALLRTLAVELNTSVLADHLELAVVGDAAPGLTMLTAERVSAHPTLPSAFRLAAEQHREQHHALVSLASGSVRQARLHPEADGAFAPLIAVADLDEVKDPAAVRELSALVSARPRTATAALLCGSGMQPPSQAWHMDTDGLVAVPGCPVVVTELVVLSENEYADLMEMALTARSDGREAAASADTGSVYPGMERGYEAPDAAFGEDREEPDDTGAEPRDWAEAEAEPPDGSSSLTAQPAGSGDIGAGASQPPVELSKPLSTPSPASGTTHPAASAPSPAAMVLPAARTGQEQAAAWSPETASAPAHTAPLFEGDPVIRVLGPVQITGARGSVASNRRTAALELAVWLALNPGQDHVAMDNALHPGEIVSRKSRNSRISHVRAWLGTDDDGRRYFPQLSEVPDRRYRFSSAVRCDWHLFKALMTRSERADEQAASALIRQALELVRGRPFSDAPPFHYSWAEPAAQDMISAIVDAAETLSESCLTANDPRGALWAATKGLSAAPEIEQLHRIRFRAYAALGDLEGLERAARQLEAINEKSTGDGMDAETVALLRSLLRTAGRQ